MTKHETAQPDAIAQAIVALTAAAKQTRTVGAGIWSEHQEAADFAELAAVVLKSVAANVGGTEELLAGRPGSWEADLVRQLVDGTARGDVNRYCTHDDGTHVEP